MLVQISLSDTLLTFTRTLIFFFVESCKIQSAKQPKKLSVERLYLSVFPQKETKVKASLWLKITPCPPEPAGSHCFAVFAWRRFPL